MVLIDRSFFYKNLKQEFNNIEDFLQNPSFRRWVLNSDAGKNLFWEHWQKENPEKVEAFEEAVHLLLAMSTKSNLPNPTEKYQILDQITANINYHDATKKLRKRIFSIAATLVLILSASFIFYLVANKFNDGVETPEETVVADRIEKHSEKGQKTKFILPDGSSVYLNSASKIIFDSDFSSKNRNVLLEGEAYFEIAPDSLLPFIVTSGLVTVEALGTSFNINSYDEKFKVQLITGKIKIQNDQDKVYLDPGLESTLTHNKSFAVKAYDLNKAALWKSGILLFERTPLADCFRQLERWYNVEIEIIGEMPANAVVSGKFDNDYLVNVMESIAYSLDIKFELDGKKVMVRSK